MYTLCGWGLGDVLLNKLFLNTGLSLVRRVVENVVFCWCLFSFLRKLLVWCLVLALFGVGFVFFWGH